MSTDVKPLSGIRVIDLSTFIAAGGAARILADQGAEVIKVEPLEGEPFRGQGFLLTCPTKDEENPAFDIENANKKFIAVDLRTAEGREIVHKLLQDADVMITNYREDALVRLGLSYDEISAKYPRLVYGHVTAYGEKGPDLARPGYDVVAFLARSGLMTDTLVEGATPWVNMAGLGDQPTAVAMAQGVAAALVKQQRDGKGDKVTVSLYHVAIWMVSILMCGVQYKANFPASYSQPALTPIAGHPYRCADGRWIIFMVLDYKKNFADFCKSLGLEEWIEKYPSALAVKQNQTEIVPDLAKIIGTKTYEEWSAIWTQIDLPFDAVRQMHEIATDEQAIVNNFIHPITYQSGKSVYLPTSPMQFRNMGIPEYEITTGVGSDTTAILQQLGYSQEKINKLLSAQVIRSK